jgi:hypothetical protein
VGLERCRAIIAISPLWSVPDELVDQATKELDRSGLPMEPEQRKSMSGLLSGLAHIAGLKRSSGLADVVGSLGLRAVTARQVPFLYREVLSGVIEASAAFTERRAQLEWIGGMLTRFAFAAQRREDADFLVSVIDSIYECDDQAQAWLGRARGAAEAFALSAGQANIAAE